MSQIWAFTSMTLNLPSGYTFDGAPFSLNFVYNGFTYLFMFSTPGTTSATSDEVVLVNTNVNASYPYSGMVFSSVVVPVPPFTITGGSYVITNIYGDTIITGPLTLTVSGTITIPSNTGKLSTGLNFYPLSFSIQAIPHFNTIGTFNYLLSLEISAFHSGTATIFVNRNNQSSTIVYNLDYPESSSLLFVIQLASGTLKYATDFFATITIFVNRVVQNGKSGEDALIPNHDGSANYSLNIGPVANQSVSTIELTMNNVSPTGSPTDTRLVLGTNTYYIALNPTEIPGQISGDIMIPTSDLTIPATVAVAITDPPNSFNFPALFADYGVVVIVPGVYTASTSGPVVVYEDGSASASGTILISCLHGGSLITTHGGRKRLDQIISGDRVWTGQYDNHGKEIYAWVDALVSCWITYPGPPHDAVIMEQNSLGHKRPTHRLIIDPGHPISISSKKREWIPAGSLVGRPGIYTLKWNDPKIQEDPSPRYDLILKGPHQSYVANGVMVASRKSFHDAGYHHSHKEFV